MKVLVTGANGFIGRSLCEYLGNGGHEVVAVVRRACELADARVCPEHDDDAWRTALRGCECVVHLAGRAHILDERETDPLAAFRSANVAATLELARRAASVDVKRFIFISSIGVNGNGTIKGRHFSAADAPAPHDAYSQSKLEAEQALAGFCREAGLELVVIRPPLVYGPGAKGNFAALLRLAATGIPLPLGAIDNRRSMIALDNLVSFLALCADRRSSPSAANEVFLISDGQPVSTTEFIRQIRIAIGRRPRLLAIPPWMLRFAAVLVRKSAMADRLLGSLEIRDDKAATLLGWQPPVTMTQQLGKLVRAAPD